MTAFSWAAFGFIIPQFKVHVTSYDTAQILPDVYDGHSMLYIEKFLRPGISYYSGMYGREWDPVKDPDLEALLQKRIRFSSSCRNRRSTNWPSPNT